MGQKGHEPDEFTPRACMPENTTRLFPRVSWRARRVDFHSLNRYTVTVITYCLHNTISMHLQFQGAARTVTGSMHMLTVGGKDRSPRLWNVPWPP